MVKHCRITVPGKPVPAPRPRVTRRGAYMPKPYKDFLGVIRRSWEMSGRPTFPDGTPLRVQVTCFTARPKSHLSRDGVKNGSPSVPIGRPDLDNLAKSFLDGLNGKAYEDDSRVVSLFAEKRYTRGDPYSTVSISIWSGK